MRNIGKEEEEVDDDIKDQPGSSKECSNIEIQECSSSKATSMFDYNLKKKWKLLMDILKVVNV